MRSIDRYGHIMVSSKSFPNREKAVLEVQSYLDRGTSDADAGLYTAMLWPSTVEVEGEVFKAEANDGA